MEDTNFNQYNLMLSLDVCSDKVGFLKLSNVLFQSVRQVQLKKHVLEYGFYWFLKNSNLQWFYLEIQMDFIYSCMPSLVGLFHLKWYFFLEN